MPVPIAQTLSSYASTTPPVQYQKSIAAPKARIKFNYPVPRWRVLVHVACRRGRREAPPCASPTSCTGTDGPWTSAWPARYLFASSLFYQQYFSPWSAHMNSLCTAGGQRLVPKQQTNSLAIGRLMEVRDVARHSAKLGSERKHEPLGTDGTCMAMMAGGC